MTVAQLIDIDAKKTKMSNEVYQTSTMLALLDGIYDGVISFEDLKKHGDFGIGTFDQLDGEMIAFDNEFYHLRSDGSAEKVEPEETTPFATVTFFEKEMSYTVEHSMNREEVEALLHELMPSKNLFYGIRMDGTFREVRTRTVPRQEKPYTPLVEVTKSQPIFSFENTEGTLAGFWTPDYAQGIGVAGFHLHYIDDERSGGGHVFDYVIENCTIQICQKAHMHLALPETADFMAAELSRENLEDNIATAEGAE
ncbi:acetolactate decarboxylase [Bacillus thuringiensis]|uniref:alpha-acetolactate decarboxylase n=1 Tax=Bacillus TaxID=1386 RepID=UPI0008E195BA|nr:MULTISPECIES: alpha-acetolactate decarboxylase [Bacillus]HDR8109292.1 alpha-acetolactate decarboxylase [Bacillus cereus]MYW22445.1 alpha-acetolactate decarboxylase [Bacillus thuringiensis]PGL14997.1 acetolactate decarboxylase [Bacillus thuringiensis]PGQ53078.1 acetolactate decarboxylase [Bacillus thuringiensis]SFM11836.1 acetolactate decarboxylase [Bacillus sp. 5mfcol3.1]